MTAMKEQLTMMNEMLEHIKDDPKMLPTIAEIMYRLFRELIQVGFTEEQATQIVANYKTT